TINITFAASTNTHPILLTREGTPLSISGPATFSITGNGATNTIIDGGGSTGTLQHMILSIGDYYSTDSTVNISGVTLRNGYNPNGYSGSGSQSGGGTGG